MSIQNPQPGSSHCQSIQISMERPLSWKGEAKKLHQKYHALKTQHEILRTKYNKKMKIVDEYCSKVTILEQQIKNLEATNRRQSQELEEAWKLFELKSTENDRDRKLYMDLVSAHDKLQEERDQWRKKLLDWACYSSQYDVPSQAHEKNSDLIEKQRCINKTSPEMGTHLDLCKPKENTSNSGQSSWEVMLLELSSRTRRIITVIVYF